MSHFPLYDNLLKDSKETNLTATQKKSFIKKMQNIDTSGHELIYALIKTYQIDNKEQNTSFTLPYDGEYVDNNISFNLDKLPNKLKHILYKFINIHINKMEEEKNKHTSHIQI